MSNSNEPRDLLDELETLQRVLDDAASDQVDQATAIPVIEPGEDIPVLSDALTDKTMSQSLPSEPPLLKPEAPVLKAVAAPAFNPNLPSSNEAIFPVEEEAASFHAHSIADLIDNALDNNEEAFVDLFDQQPELPNNDDVEIPTLLDSDVFAPPEPQQPAAPQQAVTTEQPPETQRPAPQAKSTVASNNPFLPQAVLERLAREREAAQYSAEQAQATMAKIMGTPPTEPTPSIEPTPPVESTATSTRGSSALSELHKTAIIDRLVYEMMPEIEARLRKILAEKL